MDPPWHAGNTEKAKPLTVRNCDQKLIQVQRMAGNSYQPTMRAWTRLLSVKSTFFFMSESKYWAFLGPHKLFVVTASSIKVHMETMDFFQDLQALLSCEFLRGLRSLLESNSLLGTYSQVTWSCSRMTVMAFEITSMPCSYIYRNRHIHTERKHWSLSTAASCKRSNVITQSASTYSDMVSER